MNIGECAKFHFKFYKYIWKGRPIAPAVSRWLPTAAAPVRSWVWSSGICGGQSGRFSPSTSVSPANSCGPDILLINFQISILETVCNLCLLKQNCMRSKICFQFTCLFFQLLKILSLCNISKLSSVLLSNT
jgi:hypothetical protein